MSNKEKIIVLIVLKLVIHLLFLSIKLCSREKLETMVMQNAGHPGVI